MRLKWLQNTTTRGKNTGERKFRMHQGQNKDNPWYANGRNGKATTTAIAITPEHSPRTDFSATNSSDSSSVISIGHRWEFGGESSSPDPSSYLGCIRDTTSLELGDYRLLHHFTTVLSTLISPKSMANPFQTHLTSMAFERGPLQSAILSLAASHLEKMSPQAGPGTALAATRHYQMTVRSLAAAVESSTDILSDSTLAAILMLQVRRQFVDDMNEAPECHLAAAKEIIRLRGGPSALSTACSQFLFSIFSYHDILGSISQKRVPLIPDHRHILPDPAAPFYSGITEILDIVSSVSMLQPWKNGTEEVTSSQMNAAVQLLEHKLETWSPPPEACEDQDLFHTARAYHSAAYIYLLRVAYNIGTPHPRTLHRVRICLDALAQVPVTSSLASIHVWPLFTAGCEAVEMCDRQSICLRFENMYKERGMLSLIRVREAMETVWVCKDMEESDARQSLGCLEALGAFGVQIDLV